MTKRFITLFIVLFYCSISVAQQHYDATYGHSLSLDMPGNVNATWTVPLGVTTIAFEMWGAGGNGGPNGGGQGGGYVHGTMKVQAGQIINLLIGSCNGYKDTHFGTFIAFGGADNGANNAGGFTVPAQGDINNMGWGLAGQFSRMAEYITHIFPNADHDLQTYQAGNGGDAANAQHTGGAGILSIMNYNMSGIAVPVFVGNPIPAVPGNSPGGGGGGGQDYSSNLQIMHLAGALGGNGKIIIYY